MDLSRTVSEINGDFSRKSQNFPTAHVFCAPAEGFPSELGIGAPDQKLEWWSYQVQKNVWRYPQLSGYNPATCQTDGQTNRHWATAKTALTHSVAL